MKLLQISILTIALIITAACTKVIAYGQTANTTPITHTYSSNLQTALHQTEAALKSLGYNVLRTDESRNRVTTGWTPTKVDSHYLPLFDRKDYGGSAGSYYQVVADVFEEGPKVKVKISTTVKSIGGRLKSSHKVEKQVLARIDDYMRSPQIVITNVGLQER